MLQDLPESITVNSIVSFAEVHKTHVEWCAIITHLKGQLIENKLSDIHTTKLNMVRLGTCECDRLAFMTRPAMICLMSILNELRS